MPDQLLSAYSSWAFIATAVAVLAAVLWQYRPQGAALADDEDVQVDFELSNVAKQLAATLPNQVTLADSADIVKYRKSYYAQQSSKITPGCVVRPEDADQLRHVVEILREEHHKRQQEHGSGGGGGGGIFTIRSGGHAISASTMHGGVVIDMTGFKDIVVSKDKKSVRLGAGNVWGDINDTLEAQGLYVAGGRDANVGVGGFITGGGISFFSTEVGFVASTVLEFEIMLSSGKLVTATPTKNTDLWKALQGGSGSFGIVTSITVPTIAKRNIWWGYLVPWNFDIKNCTEMMHKLLTRNGPRSTDVAKDIYGAGPLLCHGCAETGRQTSALILVHTKPGDERGWPATFKTAFGSIWRIWSQFRVDPLSKTLGFIASTSLYGERRHFATLTVKNDLDTLHEAYAIHVDTIKSLFVDKKKIKGLSYNFVVQPLPPVSVPEGQVGPMGFTSADNEPLALLLITVGWADVEDDDLINGCSKKTIERWQQMARTKGTLHPYIYLNYAADWQKPFESYGKEWLEFMRGVSKKHDETGLFQAGRSGGFKLFE